ncbi:helix-turn-helix domain-containing protein [Arcicella sp. DC2W]|uniref:Helix-turn-helix domain-containing protein n=1 Tax=Arcicella gelida TaxID=2984195 RepID=A0ABU5S4E6_9BACT|nr:helix-turn-helix domain-containing protein [Arcicella sp. DC2W]MEA5403295.1 helix-turn-helix domain-containing protein [Arcicella sp. DC2W]
MMNTEILNKYNESRQEYKPYGLTCELWTPNLMSKPDRHNEIELNYFVEGNMTYLFNDRKIVIPAKRIAVFWGLTPHQIIDCNTTLPYYVCTIPFSQFLSWNLPSSFVDKILRGEVIVASTEKYAVMDEFMFKNWNGEINQSSNMELILLEVHARLLRLALETTYNHHEFTSTQKYDFSVTEQIVVYITQNYLQPISIADIGTAVGLHPDYANSIFKKAFGCTLHEYIIQERISHAQRKLTISNQSITEIAFECGFNSISRFNATFRKMNGCTPREYRKTNILL